MAQLRVQRELILSPDQAAALQWAGRGQFTLRQLTQINQPELRSPEQKVVLVKV